MPLPWTFPLLCILRVYYNYFCTCINYYFMLSFFGIPLASESWIYILILEPYCCCSVIQLCPTLFDPTDCSTPGFPVLNYLPEFAQTHVHWVSDAINHFILCRPLLLPSTFPSIRVFSNESALRLRGPKYWSFSFNISPSSPGQISFRIDWFDLLAAQGTLKSLVQT